MKFQFGNVVVVEDDCIGVIVKFWNGTIKGPHYDVYVRAYNNIREYSEGDMKHFVYSKMLSEEELEFYE